MTGGQAMRRIVLPQALRIVIPPIGNDTISMLKFTSLVSVLALPDLLYSAQEIYARTYQTIPMLLVATLWYLVLTTILTVIEHLIEKRLRRGHRDTGRRTAMPASALAAPASLAGLGAGGAVMTGEPLVVVDRVRKSFRSTVVLNGLSFEVVAGEVCCIIGPSGSGKTTMLRCINRLEKIDAGMIYVAGRPVGVTVHGSRLREMRPGDLAEQRHDIGMVFQSFNLFAHKTVLANIIEAPVVVKKTRRAAAVSEAHALLAPGGSHGQGRTPTRRSCPAGSSSGSRSPGRWPCIRS